MRPEELVAIASSRGTDLSFAYGNSNKTDGIARLRKRTKAELDLRIPVRESARGTETRSYRRPAFSVAELGLAAGGCTDRDRAVSHEYDARIPWQRPPNGVPRLPWLAVRHSWGRDISNYAELHRGLATFGIKIATREHWPLTVVGDRGERFFYLEKLAGLVLDADRETLFFTSEPRLYAWVMGMSEELYPMVMARKYAMLREVYDRWIGTAAAMIRQWMMDEDFSDRRNAAAGG